ncbi:uncharacterized protein [Hyperolius riggenbachi]|uniref:uncharacterized protein isoform X2 n=2 Tax=Hyperolius riggenbachi TaxID=752182 RepID=UPI0035A293A1
MENQEIEIQASTSACMSPSSDGGKSTSDNLSWIEDYILTNWNNPDFIPDLIEFCEATLQTYMSTSYFSPHKMTGPSISMGDMVAHLHLPTISPAWTLPTCLSSPRQPVPLLPNAAFPELQMYPIPIYNSPPMAPVTMYPEHLVMASSPVKFEAVPLTVSPSKAVCENQLQPGMKGQAPCTPNSYSPESYMSPAKCPANVAVAPGLRTAFGDVSPMLQNGSVVYQHPLFSAPYGANCVNPIQSPVSPLHICPPTPPLPAYMCVRPQYMELASPTPPTNPFWPFMGRIIII